VRSVRISWTNNASQFCEADTAHRAKAAKTPDMLLGSSVVQILMRLSQVDSSIDLSQFWYDVAPESKAQQRNVLQRAVDEAMLNDLLCPGWKSHSHSDAVSCQENHDLALANLVRFL
jgi:hypothetical protein